MAPSLVAKENPCRRGNPGGRQLHVDRELELDFIREFATGAESLTGLSDDGRRERIRMGIYARKLAPLLFRDGPMTYAETFKQCFGQPIEQRRIVRPKPAPEAPIAQGSLQTKAV
jgi:hypothetical protein